MRTDQEKGQRRPKIDISGSIVLILQVVSLLTNSHPLIPTAKNALGMEELSDRKRPDLDAGPMTR